MKYKIGDYIVYEEVIEGEPTEFYGIIIKFLYDGGVVIIDPVVLEEDDMERFYIIEPDQILYRTLPPDAGVKMMADWLDSKMKIEYQMLIIILGMFIFGLIKTIL